MLTRRDSTIRFVFQVPESRRFAVCGAQCWPAHPPIASHPASKGLLGEPSSPFRDALRSEDSTASHTLPAILLESSWRRECPFHTWPSLYHAFYGSASHGGRSHPRLETELRQYRKRARVASGDLLPALRPVACCALSPSRPRRTITRFPAHSVVKNTPTPSPIVLRSRCPARSH